MLGFGKANKMWMGALVSFLSLSAITFFGIKIDPVVQNLIVGILTGGVVWAVPNTA